MCRYVSVDFYLYIYVCVYVYLHLCMYLRVCVCMYVCSSRETLSRSLLLVVSLGYGIVRPKLMTTEWVAIAVVSTLYFITGTRRTYTSTHTYINTCTSFLAFIHTYSTYMDKIGHYVSNTLHLLYTTIYIHTFIHSIIKRS